jgi:hypothetical protein
MPMIDDVAWLLFIVASLVLIVTPGQDMILVMSRSNASLRPRLTSTAPLVRYRPVSTRGRARSQPDSRPAPSPTGPLTRKVSAANTRPSTKTASVGCAAPGCTNCGRKAK